MKRLFFDEIEISCAALGSIARRIAVDCGKQSSFSVFTLNLDHVVKLRRLADFRAAYRKARYVTADGMPVVWAGRLSGTQVHRVTGSDLIEPLCAEAAKMGHSVYLFGSEFQSLSGAAQYLTKSIPDLEIAGVCAPEYGFDPHGNLAAGYAKQIAESGASICFVALGAPKQEIFSSRAVGNSSGVAFVCIGAGLDFLSGAQTRAPKWVRRAGVEWIWRLLSNPRRLAQRYFACLLVLPAFLLASTAKQ